jgi:hypothetical protein
MRLCTAELRPEVRLPPVPRPHACAGEQDVGLPDTRFSLAMCYDIHSRPDHFAHRADGFCMKGLSSDLTAP